MVHFYSVGSTFPSCGREVLPTPQAIVMFVPKIFPHFVGMLYLHCEICSGMFLQSEMCVGNVPTHFTDYARRIVCSYTLY